MAVIKPEATTATKGFVEQSSTPSTPSAGEVRLYAKTNKKLYTLDSDGNEIAVGSNAASSTGTNYVKNPSGLEQNAGAAPLNWTAVSNCTLTKTSTAAELPRENTTASGIKLVFSAAGEAYCELKNLDDVDLNRMLQAAMAAKVISGAGAVTISVRKGGSYADPADVLGTVLLTGTDSLPKFDFASGNTATHRLYIKTTGAVTLTLSDIFVGPGTLVSAPRIGGWKSFVPVFSNVTVTVNKAILREIGDSIEILMDVTATTDATGTVFFLINSTGYTENTGLIGSTGSRMLLGSGKLLAQTANWNADPIYTGTANQINFRLDGAGLLSGTEPTSEGGIDQNDRLVAHIVLPVNELSASAYYGAEGTEYASNSSTATAASDTTSFIYGPQGAQIQNITANLKRRVRFGRAIQPTDIPMIEISEDRVHWFPAMGYRSAANNMTISTLLGANATNWGIGFSNVSGSATDLDVFFGAYAAPGATWDSGGLPWTTGNAGSWYWRVRLASAASVAGFNVATTAQPTGLYKAGNAPGILGGASAAAGCIGEKIEVTLGSAQSTNAFNTFITALDLPIPSAGVWLVLASGVCTTSSAPSSGTVICMETQLLNVEDNATIQFLSPLGKFSSTSFPASSITDDATNICFSLGGVVIATAARTIRLRARSAALSGSPTVGGVTVRDGSKIIAVRIA